MFKRRRSERLRVKREGENVSKKRKYEEAGDTSNPDLPNEILEKIIAYVPHWERASFACANRYWSVRTWDIAFSRHVECACGRSVCTCDMYRTGVELEERKAKCSHCNIHVFEWKCPCPKCVTEQTVKWAIDYADTYLDGMVVSGYSQKKKDEFLVELDSVRRQKDRSSLFRYRQVLSIIDDIKEYTKNRR